MQSLTQWTKVTGDLPWGVQRVLHDTLSLVAEGKVTLVHSRDYDGKTPCLINAVGQMLKAGGGRGIPSQYFGPLVSQFDSINRHFQTVPSYNDPNTNLVSPAVAEVLLHYFAPIKEQPVKDTVDEAMEMEAFANHVYVEPSDEDFARDWTNAMQTEAKHIMLNLPEGEDGIISGCRDNEASVENRS